MIKAIKQFTNISAGVIIVVVLNGLSVLIGIMCYTYLSIILNVVYIVAVLQLYQ